MLLTSGRHTRDLAELRLARSRERNDHLGARSRARLGESVGAAVTFLRAADCRDKDRPPGSAPTKFSSSDRSKGLQLRTLGHAPDQQREIAH